MWEAKIAEKTEESGQWSEYQRKEAEACPYVPFVAAFLTWLIFSLTLLFLLTFHIYGDFF